MAKRLIAGAALLALLVTACGGPAADTDDDAVADATAEPAATADGVGSPTLAGFAEDIFASVAGETVADLFEWMLGAGGAADGDAQELAKISSQLDQIEATLKDVDQELSQIESELDRLDCDTEFNAVEDDVNTILDLWSNTGASDSSSTTTSGEPVGPQSYEGLAEAAAPESGPAYLTPAMIDEFATQVLSPSSGKPLADALSDLARGLLPQAGGAGPDGVIKSCLSGKAPKEGADYYGVSDDQWYEATAVPLVNYFYGVQLRGLAMLVDVYHYEAWKASGEKGNPADVSEVCVKPTKSAVNAACDQARQEVEGVRAAFVEQFTGGGAPYSRNLTTSAGEGQNLVLYAGNSDVFVADPGDFTTTIDTSCSSPITSQSPCGPTVGGVTLTTISGTYGAIGDFAGYTSWTAATAYQLQDIFSLAPKQYDKSYDNVSDYLSAERSISVDPDLVFATPTTINWWPSRPDVGSSKNSLLVACFVDTGWSVDAEGLVPPYLPLCDNKEPSGPGSAYNGEWTSSLTEPAPFTECSNGVRDDGPALVASTKLPASDLNKNFYNVTICNDQQANDGSVKYENDLPGWASPDGTLIHRQFHWPVIDTSTLTCSAPGYAGGTAPAKNFADMPSLCGDDLVAWLHKQVPSLSGESS